jgi:hypothetical protein
MLRKLLGHMRQNVVAYLALFIALGGTSAYAANTIRSGDIIDNEVTTTDVRDDNLGFGGLLSQDLAAGSVGTSEVANNSLGNGDFLTGSVDSRVATNDSLTGTDINESTLNMPPTTTAHFNAVFGSLGPQAGWQQVGITALSPGPWAIIATVNLEVNPFLNETQRTISTATCELRNGNTRDAGFIGGASDRRERPAGGTVIRVITMNGGAQVAAGGSGIVSVWCISPANEDASGQIMAIKLDGFS